MASNHLGSEWAIDQDWKCLLTKQTSLVMTHASQRESRKRFSILGVVTNISTCRGLGEGKNMPGFKITVATTGQLSGPSSVVYHLAEQYITMNKMKFPGWAVWCKVKPSKRAGCLFFLVPPFFFFSWKKVLIRCASFRGYVELCCVCVL